MIADSNLSRAIFAHRAKQAGKNSLVIDKRLHLDGNVYCNLTQRLRHSSHFGELELKELMVDMPAKKQESSKEGFSRVADDKPVRQGE